MVDWLSHGGLMIVVDGLSVVVYSLSMVNSLFTVNGLSIAGCSSIAKGSSIVDGLSRTQMCRLLWDLGKPQAD